MSYDAPPPPPPYGGQPQYGQPYGAPQGTNSKAIWSLVLGILGVLCCGPLGHRRADPRPLRPERDRRRPVSRAAGLAKAGWILGIVAIVFMIIGAILFATGVLTFDGTFDTA